MAKRFEIKLECDNVAPLTSFRADFEVPKLRFSLLAYNGSGKTFLSRMFDLLSKGPTIEPAEINDLITFGKDDASLKFRIAKFDPQNASTSIEDLTIDLVRDSPLTVPASQLIYHVFNDEYVQHHVAKIGYDLNGDIEVPLGDINIEIGNLRSLIDSNIVGTETLEADIRSRINSRVFGLLGQVKWITQVIEYKKLDFEHILSAASEPLITANFEAVRDEFDKLHSIPDDLLDIDPFKSNPPDTVNLPFLAPV